jgi:peptide/nickel transport system substrate-binding protein
MRGDNDMTYRVRRAVAVVAAIVLAVSACGGGGSGDEGERADEPADTAAAPPGQPTEESTEESTEPGPVDSMVAGPTEEDETADPSFAPPAGTLRVGVGTDTVSLDPHRAGPFHTHFLTPIYDTLTQVGTNGEVKPLLAASVESDDSVRWTITLVEGATFVDGSPVDADAVTYTFERGLTVGDSPSAAFFGNVASVEATDPSTVVLTLEQPNADLPRQLAGLPGMIINPALGNGDLARAGAGSGPYLFDAAASVEAVSYRYVARDDYWGTGVGAAEIVYLTLADPSARINALRSGEIDIAAELAPAEQATLSGFELVRSTDTEPLFLQITDTDGSQVPALGDPRVRRALSLGIDRQGITQALMLGAGVPTTAFWMSGSPYYSSETDGIGYDAAAARDLLAEAGYPDGFSFTVPTIRPLRQSAEAVQASLRQIGVTMEIELLQPGTMGDAVRAGEFVGTVVIARGHTPRSFFDERLAGDGPYNPFGADRSELDALADVAKRATTVEESAAAWADTYAKAVDDGYIIVVTQSATAAAIAPYVTGAQTPPGSAIPNVRNIRVDG